MITFFHISYNLTAKWNFDTDFFQVLTCCNISNFCLIEKCQKKNQQPLLEFLIFSKTQNMV